jgi:predicted dehydrogenase
MGVTDPHADGYLDMSAEMTDLFTGVVLYDPNPAALESARRKYPERVTSVHTHVDDALAQKGVGVVVVTLNNRDKPGVIIRAAQAGKHILAEKPAAVSPAALRPALDAVREAGVRFSVWYPWRYHPATRHVRQWQAEGTFGDVWACEGRFNTTQVTRGLDAAKRDEDWLFFDGLAGGGILSWLGVHWIDLFRYLLGEVVSVSAMVAHRMGPPVDVEDVAGVLLRFANGAMGTLRTGWSLPFGDKDLYLGWEGERGGLQWWPAEGRLHVRSTRPDWRAAPERTFTLSGAEGRLLPGRPGTPFTRLVWIDEFYRDFVTAARTGQDFPVTGEDALRVLEILHAAYESARTGREVVVGIRDEG